MTKTKEKLLRFGCLLLATLTLSASFVGCNKKDDKKSTKEKSTITTTEAAQLAMCVHFESGSLTMASFAKDYYASRAKEFFKGSGPLFHFGA